MKSSKINVVIADDHELVRNSMIRLVGTLQEASNGRITTIRFMTFGFIKEHSS